MKKNLLLLLFSLCYMSVKAQNYILPYDTITVVKKLKILNIANGDVRDSLATHKANGNMGRLSMNQLVIPYANLTGSPFIPTNTNQLTNGAGFLTSYTETDPLFNTKFSLKTTTDLTEGVKLYFTEPRVLSTLLAGLSTGTNTPITSSNSVLIALQNLQAQITAKIPSVSASTIGLSKAALNSTYPNTPVGYVVLAPSILLGGATYIRATAGSTGTWLSISSPPAL